MTADLQKKLVTGSIFIALGILLLLRNFDLFYLPSYLFSWQTLLIGIGVLLLLSRDKKGGGITLISIGVLFLVPDVFDISLRNIFRFFWPLLLVGIGLLIIFRKSVSTESLLDSTSDSGSSSLSSDTIDETIILGGSEKKVLSEFFRGGKITTLFGGFALDLTETQLSKGKHILDVLVLFGGIELIVPDTMNVHIQLTPILGGLQDNRSIDPRIVMNDEEQLVIKGFVLFGGGDIKTKRRVRKH
jgi:predicted membrane protein